MADLGVWTVDGDAPRRVSRSGVGLERNLEDWIANDSSLLADGLTIVGRQIRLEGGRLDLLAIDWPDRWVVIELKRGRLYRDALAQALDYASSIADMGGDDLAELLEPSLGTLGGEVELTRAVRGLLNREDETRMVEVLLAGVGVDAGLERIAKHLGAHGVPISIVSLEVFELQNGPQLLIREVTEQESARRVERSDFPDRLHAVLERVGPGNWTSYGALAEVLASSARAVARHIARCSGTACDSGYRAMTANGTVASGFYFHDPSDERDPVEVLQAEGVTFDARGRASPTQRMGVGELRGDDTP